MTTTSCPLSDGSIMIDFSCLSSSTAFLSDIQMLDFGGLEDLIIPVISAMTRGLFSYGKGSAAHSVATVNSSTGILSGLTTKCNPLASTFV